MKHIGISSLIVATVLISLSTHVWAGGMRFGGGGRGGHFGGNRFSPGSGHHQHFHHEQFFGPHHHSSPFVPFGHEQHFGHEQFHGHHFDHFGVPFHRFSSRRFFFDNRFGPAGPPPLGAPGFTPFVPFGPSTVIIRAPFFCRPHRLEFTDQVLFVEHLAQFHGIPSESAFSFCWPVGGSNRWIFFGF